MVIRLLLHRPPPRPKNVRSFLLQTFLHGVTSPSNDLLLTEEILHHLSHHMYCNPRAPNLTLVLAKLFLGLALLTEILHHLAEEGGPRVVVSNGESEGASSNSVLGGAGFLPSTAARHMEE